MIKKKWICTLTVLSLLAGCSQQGDIANSTAASGASPDSSATAETVVKTSEQSSDLFTDRDYEVGYDENRSAVITLNRDSASCNSDAVRISGSTVTITDEGTYILSGTLEDGMILVDAGSDDKVQLVLDGVDIHSSTSAAIYVRQADKVFLTLSPDSVNTLSNGGDFIALDDNNIDGAIFSKDDLTLNGGGSLTVSSPGGHGIVGKDDLVITSGTYEITAASHGVSGKDSVRIAGGSFAITSGKDGIHAENADDASLGFLYIAGGEFSITADGDGLSAENYLQIEDGAFTILTGGGSAAVVQAPSNSRGPGAAEPSPEVDTVSTKGIKAGGKLILNGGTFSIDSADDALHSNADLTVSGGSYEIATGDDGLHADAALLVNSGSIHISRSYEGLEGLTVDILDGDISLIASDDGINAAGGNDQSGFGGRREDLFAADSGAYIHIAGGTIYIDASGDGIDSNGTLTVSGGEVYLSGPTSGGDSALDFDSEGVITGGVFVATGSRQMAQNFGPSSTQGAILASVDPQQAGSTIQLTDSDGNLLVSWQADKTFDSVMISCPEIEQGASYTLTAGDYTTEITMDSLIYGSGGGMMGGGRPMGDGMGGRGNGGRRTFAE